MMADWPVVVLLGLLGAVVGSFLNVCIHRLPKYESVVRPGSRCPACGRPIRWYENIPVVSWLALRARCAGCGGRISAMYPAVELTTAAIFVAGYFAFGLTLLLVVRLAFGSALVVLAVTDLRERILPNAITYPGIAAGLVCSVFLPPGFRDSLIGVLIGAGVPFLVGEAYYRLRGVEGLGMGDVKMLGMIGAFLGWQLALFTLFVASIAGVLIGIPMTLIRKDRHYQIPLGTFLALGALVAAVAGEEIVAWYAGFYR
ncbi:MAG TPA: prepilin peptidase [Vicinamibacterales bacterium]|nr:prepilin peptidase [Vicinamibacterales bacterium]